MFNLTSAVPLFCGSTYLMQYATILGLKGTEEYLGPEDSRYEYVKQIADELEMEMPSVQVIDGEELEYSCCEAFNQRVIRVPKKVKELNEFSIRHEFAHLKNHDNRNSMQLRIASSYVIATLLENCFLNQRIFRLFTTIILTYLISKRHSIYFENRADVTALETCSDGGKAKAALQICRVRMGVRSTREDFRNIVEENGDVHPLISGYRPYSEREDLITRSIKDQGMRLKVEADLADLEKKTK